MHAESIATAAGTVAVTFIGVRHHSPACARLVRDTIRELRPAHVLIEGPADMNDRLDELLLGHDLPIAVFTSYRDDEHRHMSWAPLCDYSPEWVGLRAGRDAGAQVRFIDLPAWHRAFAGTENRYADAERRYEHAVERLCREFAVDNIDALWDHLFELGDPATLADRLAAYFELVRGDDDASDGDLTRERYMATWLDAAVADLEGRETGSGPAHIVVITGGFHRPALVRHLRRRSAAGIGRDGSDGEHSAAASGSEPGRAPLPVRAKVDHDQARSGNGPESVMEPTTFEPDGGDPATAGTIRSDATEGTAALGSPGWPVVPAAPATGAGGSYLVPFSFRRLDAFTGYQSGMPSPAYYQQLWEVGAEAAAEGITRAVVRRLRERGQAVSTASLIGARTLTVGLSRLRGHESPSRTDVLDGLAGTLITEALEQPLPWTGRGQLPVGTEPVVLEMVAALSGDTVGRLHASTPHPPLVHDAAGELRRCGIPDEGRHELDLTTGGGVDASRVLHRLRVLGIPGVARRGGPALGRAPELTEVWLLSRTEMRLPALIEAGSLGATCAEAAAARLGERFAAAGSDTGELADVLFDATLSGLSELSGRIVTQVRTLVDAAGAPTGLGKLLAVTLGLWRYDRIFGAAQSPTLAVLIDAAVLRLLWLIEGIRGGPAPADDQLLDALAAVRDAALHAAPVLSVERADLAGVFQRCTAADRPPALRGAAVGAVAVLDPAAGIDVAHSVRLAGTPELLGDFLAGLFALAREQLLDAARDDSTGSGEPLLAVLDELVAGFGDEDFLAALPALRVAFAWFPPRERARIGERLLGMRGLTTDVSALLRLAADADTLAHARAVELRVDRMLAEHGLLDPPTALESLSPGTELETPA
ncbi:DUF5682 family protein [Nocardia sp. NPDC005978]|uniref:DUF5682 family protein n=1 Tax=Nocardia sp. NPDC005978 TaxID=3156725 RepID=UPI0033A63805